MCGRRREAAILLPVGWPEQPFPVRPHSDNGPTASPDASITESESVMEIIDSKTEHLRHQSQTNKKMSEKGSEETKDTQISLAVHKDYLGVLL